MVGSYGSTQNNSYQDEHCIFPFLKFEHGEPFPFFVWPGNMKTVILNSAGWVPKHKDASVRHFAILLNRTEAESL